MFCTVDLAGVIMKSGVYVSVSGNGEFNARVMESVFYVTDNNSGYALVCSEMLDFPQRWARAFHSSCKVKGEMNIFESKSRIILLYIAKCEERELAVTTADKQITKVVVEFFRIRSIRSWMDLGRRSTSPDGDPRSGHYLNDHHFEREATIVRTWYFKDLLLLV